ncbi:MAG: hypothetical protein L6365_02765 [Desulfobulbaceae bacterium]|nr:hypothetical protein [Desulfobulbaceae bacterium]
MRNPSIILLNTASSSQKCHFSRYSCRQADGGNRFRQHKIFVVDHAGHAAFHMIEKIAVEKPVSNLLASNSITVVEMGATSAVCFSGAWSPWPLWLLFFQPG